MAVRANDPLLIRTGNLSFAFEPETGFVRQISVGNVEVVKAIYGAVRDSAWRTAPSTIGNIQVAGDPANPKITFDVECILQKIHFSWRGEITASGDSVAVNFSGLAITSFNRNRVGLCLLLPVERIAETACSVITPEGSIVEGRFPRLISPHQPLKNIRSLQWSPSPGVNASLEFSGDIFEMEDQRNWSDASYKIYSTPLDLPYPVEVRATSRIRQRIQLTVTGTTPPAAPAAAPLVRLRAQTSHAKCSIGHALPPGFETAGELELSYLKIAVPAHLRVELKLSDPAWKPRWEAALQLARTLGSRLECALHLTDNAATESESFAEVAIIHRAFLTIIPVYHFAEKVTSSNWMEIVQSKLSSFELAAATNGHFAEINRIHPPPGYLTAFSMTPQVHTFDNRSILENIAAQASLVETALHNGSPGVIISPITLRPRFNSSLKEDVIGTDGLPFSVDPRLRELIAAAWTVGSLSRLTAIPEVRALTYFESWGWRGLFQNAAPTNLRFSAAPGEIFPVFHVFAALAGFEGIGVAENTQPEKVAALVLTSQNRTRILLANLTNAPHTIELQLDHPPSALRVLDETTLEKARNDATYFSAATGNAPILDVTRLLLGPYGVARVDLD